MNRFGGLCLVVGVCVAVLAPVDGVGDYQPCTSCKNPQAPSGPQEIDVVTPGKFKFGIGSPLDLSSPTNDTTNNHDLSPDVVAKIKELTTCKRQERSQKQADIMKSYGSKVLEFCQKAFNNMRYKVSSEAYFCKSKSCTVQVPGSSRKVNGNCNNSLAGVNDTQALTELEIEYELKVEDPDGDNPGKVKVICEIKGDPCPCYYRTPKESEPLLSEEDLYGETEKDTDLTGL